MRQTNLSFSSLSSSFPSTVQPQLVESTENVIKTASHVLFIQPSGQKFLVTPPPHPPSPKSPSPPPLTWTKTIQQLFSTRHTYIWKCVSKSVLNIKERLTCITNNRFTTINKKTRKPNLSRWKSFYDTPFPFDMGPRKYTSTHLPEAYRRGLKYLLWCW